MILSSSKFVGALLAACALSQLGDGADVPLKVQNSYRIVSGLQLEMTVKSYAHLYKSYVPLIFQFTVPRWNKSDTILFGSQNCNTTQYTKFFTTCPVLYHLNEVHDRFSEYIFDNQPLVVTLEQSGATPENTLIPFDCEVIQPHFEDIYVDKVTLDDYVNRLKSCSPLGSQDFIQGISNYVYNVSNPYSEMRRNFYTEYWLKIDLIDGRVDAAIWSNAVNLYNSLLFQNYMIEINRWKLALVDCEAGRIPSTVLPPSLLSDTLNDMLDSLGKQKLRPSVNINSIGNYYKASLTDCTFSNNTFLVRVLVPVIPSNEQYALVRVRPVSFYYKDEVELQCQIDPRVLPQKEVAFVLVDLVRNIAFESDCKPGTLCHIPTELHPKKVNPCVTAAFNWERYQSKNETLTNELLRNCPMKCSPIQNFQRNSLEQAGGTQFLWFSGGTENKVSVNCTAYSPTTGVRSLVHTTKPMPLGATLLDTNCNCKISYGSNVVKSTTCNSLANYKPNTKNDQIKIVNLAPVMWYPNLRSFKGLWNVSQSLFSNPDPQNIRKLLAPIENQYSSIFETKESSGSQFSGTVLLLSLASIALCIVVGAIGWRLHKLVVQLEGMGLNVRDRMVVGNGGSNHGGGQNVSYRNMNAVADTDNLLINAS